MLQEHITTLRKKLTYVPALRRATKHLKDTTHLGVYRDHLGVVHIYTHGKDIPYEMERTANAFGQELDFGETRYYIFDSSNRLCGSFNIELNLKEVTAHISNVSYFNVEKPIMLDYDIYHRLKSILEDVKGLEFATFDDRTISEEFQSMYTQYCKDNKTVRL